MWNGIWSLSWFLGICLFIPGIWFRVCFFNGRNKQRTCELMEWFHHPSVLRSWLKRRPATADPFTNHSSTNARVEHAETPDWLSYYIRLIFVVNLLYFTCPKTKHVSNLWHIDRSIGLEQVRMIHWNLEFSSQNTMVLGTFEPLDG